MLCDLAQGEQFSTLDTTYATLVYIVHASTARYTPSHPSLVLPVLHSIAVEPTMHVSEKTHPGCTTIKTRRNSIVEIFQMCEAAGSSTLHRIAYGHCPKNTALATAAP